MGYKRVLGAKRSPIDVRDYKIKVCATFEFPETFELNAPPVRNQGDMPTCVAHATSSCHEYFYRLQHPDSESADTKMSVLAIYCNRKPQWYQGEGMVIIDGAAAGTEYGDVFYSQLPGNMTYAEGKAVFEAKKEELRNDAYLHRFTGYARAESTNAIKQALMFHGPVLFGVDWYEDMKYKDGLLNSELRINADGGHCMFIYGWNEKGWLIQNSWGPCWGKRGRAVIPFDLPIYDTISLMDEYIEGDVPIDVIVPIKTKIGKFFAKIINAIINAVLRLVGSNPVQ